MVFPSGSTGIELFVLLPRSPKLNGHVERIQRTYKVRPSDVTQDEFYTRPLPSRVGELQVEPDAYLAYYNGRRPHMALCTRTDTSWTPEG